MMVWLLVQELTIVGKRWGGREAMAWFKAHEYMKDVVEGTNVITGHKCNKGHKCNNIWSQL